MHVSSSCASRISRETEGYHCTCLAGAAHLLSEWRQADSFAPEAVAFGEHAHLPPPSSALPMGVTLSIVTAPAAFALPMVQRKVFKPPFAVRAGLSC